MFFCILPHFLPCIIFFSLSFLLPNLSCLIPPGFGSCLPRRSTCTLGFFFQFLLFETTHVLFSYNQSSVGLLIPFSCVHSCAGVLSAHVSLLPFFKKPPFVYCCISVLTWAAFFSFPILANDVSDTQSTVEYLVSSPGICVLFQCWVRLF